MLDSDNRNREYIANNHYTRPLIVASFQGRSGGAMVLGKLPVPGRSAGLGSNWARAYCACSGCRWACFCSRLSFLFFPPLWETARYRLKYCLKGRETQNNQPNVAYLASFLTTQNTQCWSMLSKKCMT